MASKMSRACGISAKVRQEVLERDNHSCIVCGRNHGLQIAHYISRARGGKGTPQNLAAMCVVCHRNYDNGKYHREYKAVFEFYLKSKYDNWNEKDLIYRKWG